MAANSTQGIGVLVFLVAFVALSGVLFTGGNLLYLAVFVVGLVVSVMFFLKAKPMEHDRQ